MAKRFKFRISRLIIPCFRPCCPKHPASTDDDFLWEKEDKWHVIAKVYNDNTAPSRRKIHNSSVSGGSGPDDVLPLPSSKRRYKKKRRTTPRGRSRVSTSSADRSCGLFSSDGYDDEEETEALVSSSRSDTPPHKERELTKKKRKEKTVWRVAARLSAFEGVMGWKVEGKVRESVAVVKKSEDPYHDFRRSMMEMIVEKKMFEQKDLEQLLCCFLSLNSTKYHPVIVQAFTDIWETLFCFCINGNS
ncbi:transcription repressor OFP7-like [Neltuma alba]|uniref:transcription repressor OFP7-like n=1 Tax=Neltuma alba TaxID=207710 RepID=UPI0010A41919|nr:transcription repressor OFP7-like [Prosopis alba]